MTTSLVLVDSSYYIRKAARREDPFADLDELADAYEFATCGIVWMEVLRGRSDPALRKRYEERFATMIFCNLTPSAWRRAADLTWRLDRTGAVIPATDLTIAACALEHGACLLTFDRHFSHIPGLLATDWLE